MIDIDAILLVGAAVVIVAILAARIGTRVGLPSLLLFLGLGMLLGESGPGSSSTTPTWPTPSASPPWSSSWPRAA